MTKVMPDAVRSTLAYLRLWKICDVELSLTNKYDSARVFDVIPFDEAKVLAEIRELDTSDLSWASEPEELHDDINDVLALATKREKTENDLNALKILRDKFQNYALKYSGDINLASGHGAGA